MNDSLSIMRKSFLFLCLGFLPTLALAAGEDDDRYTLSQFESDCEAAGGQVVDAPDIVVCDFSVDEEDIVCEASLEAGGVSISNCSLGAVARVDDEKPFHGSFRFGHYRGGDAMLEISRGGNNLSPGQARQMLKKKMKQRPGFSPAE